MKLSWLIAISLLLVHCADRRHKVTHSPDISKVQSNDSVNWKALGPFGAPMPIGNASFIAQNGTGAFMCLSINPENSKDILIGHASAGIFRTTDGGMTYTQTLHLGFATGVYKIERFADNPKHLIAATANLHENDLQYGYGLIESVDGGASWFRNSLKVDPSSEAQEPFMDVVITDPKKCKSLVSISRHKVYLSNNAGLSWQMSFESQYDLKHIVVSKEDPQTMVICGNGILVSTDGGYTFNDITSDISSVFGLISNEQSLYHAAFSIKHPGMLYFVSQNQTVNIVTAYLNDLSEPKWLDYNQVPLSKTHLTFNVQVEDGDEKLWLGTSRLFKSKPAPNGIGQVDGPTFTRIGTSLSGHADFLNDGINAIDFDDKNQVWICTDGGVSVFKKAHDESRTSGKLALVVSVPPSLTSITSHALNLNASLLLGFDRAANNTILAGAGSNGIIVYQNGKWQSANMAGFADRVVALGDSLKFASIFSNTNYLTSDNARSFKYAHAGSEKVASQMAYHALSGNFFIANTQLFRKQGSGYFELINSGINSEHQQIAAFYVDPLNDKDIWLAYKNTSNKFDKVLWRTDNGGLSWKDLSASLPILKNATVSGIFKNNREIAISFKQLDKKDELNKVYISYDGGRTFHNQSKGLPNLPVYCLVNVSGRWICGTANGVYIFDQKQWKPLGKNFPEVGVSDMKYFPADKMLLVATTGRGLWGIALK